MRREQPTDHRESPGARHARSDIGARPGRRGDATTGSGEVADVDDGAVDPSSGVVDPSGRAAPGWGGDAGWSDGAAAGVGDVVGGPTGVVGGAGGVVGGSGGAGRWDGAAAGAGDVAGGAGDVVGGSAGATAGSGDAALSALDDAVHRALLAAGDGADAFTGDPRVAVERLVGTVAPLLGADAAAGVVGRVLARVGGLGPLEPLLADPTVSEVMCNGGGPVWVERDGHLVCTDVVLDAATVGHLIERVVAPLGRRIDRSSAMVDARLEDGSRVNAVVPPLAVDGPCLTIRRFAARPVELDVVCPAGVAHLLRWAVRARANVVVCGGAGAGKTTLLNALAGSIPADERVITIEDAAELRLPSPHVVRLEARPANAEGVGEVTIRELVRNALRMRPDRIVVGEVRGAEVVDMVAAMTTGHDGSLSTCHANGPADALRRLELLLLLGGVDLPLAAVREHLASAIDLVVHVARRPDGSRRVLAVDEVVAAGDRTMAAVPPTRPLASPDGLAALPERPVRAPGVPGPDPSWLRRR